MFSGRRGFDRESDGESMECFVLEATVEAREPLRVGSVRSRAHLLALNPWRQAVQIRQMLCVRGRLGTLPMLTSSRPNYGWFLVCPVLPAAPSDSHTSHCRNLYEGSQAQEPIRWLVGPCGRDHSSLGIRRCWRNHSIQNWHIFLAQPHQLRRRAACLQGWSGSRPTAQWRVGAVPAARTTVHHTASNLPDAAQEAMLHQLCCGSCSSWSLSTAERAPSRLAGLRFVSCAYHWCIHQCCLRFLVLSSSAYGI